jgi:Zn-dependent oligopeptidase
MTMLLTSPCHVAGLMNRRQGFFTTYDMLLHTTQKNARPLPRHADSGRIDTAKAWAQLRKDITWTEQPPNTNPAASFGHLMAGYAHLFPRPFPLSTHP